MSNALILTNLLLGLLDRAGAIGTLLTKAQAEGRDITAEELDGLFQADADARALLDAEIARQRAVG